MRNTGWAWFGYTDYDILSLQGSGVVKTPEEYPGLDAVAYQLDHLACDVGLEPEVLVLEGYYPYAPRKSMMHGIMLVGGLFECALQGGGSTYLYNPTHWKREVKKHLFVYDRKGKSQHEKDAIDLGLLHIKTEGDYASEVYHNE